MARRAILVAVSIFLCSCIYVPDMGADSPSEEARAEIKEGALNQEEVVSLLGEPDVTREDGSIAIYDNSRITGHVIGVPIPVPGVGVLGTGFHNPIEKLESTQIEFNEGIAISISTITDGYGCYKNGVCLDSGWTTHGGPRLIPEITALSSTREDDKQAKAFAIQEGRCSLYIYTVGNHIATYPVLLSIAEHRLLPISPTGYLHLNLPRGKLVLKVFHSGTTYIVHQEPELLVQANATCSASSIAYLQINYSRGESGPNSRSAKVDLVEHEKGRNEVLNRRLLLLP